MMNRRSFFATLAAGGAAAALASGTAMAAMPTIETPVEPAPAPEAVVTPSAEPVAAEPVEMRGRRRARRARRRVRRPARRTARRAARRS